MDIFEGFHDSVDLCQTRADESKPLARTIRRNRTGIGGHWKS